MSDFLETMAASSDARWRHNAESETLEALRTRALATPIPHRLRLDGRFDLIAEVKLVAPSAGRLAAPVGDRAAFVVAQARRYEAAGACAISVLTEPDRFDGQLSDLVAVAAAVGVPAMRKDFLVSPYQVWEARASGAGGVLLIVRMLSQKALVELVDAAIMADLFVLLEAFDAEDLERATALAAQWPHDAPPLLVGVNTRDLSTLQVAEGRLETLAAAMPPGVPGVAESGLRTPADAARARGLGYTVALIGSALMASAEPESLGRAMLAAARA